MTATTNTDACVDDWSIDDAVLRLRHWAGDRMHVLPPPGPGEYAIGSAEDCWARIVDAKQLISKRHAVVTHERGKWIVRNLGKNGIKLDGVRTPEGVLEPGTELLIGDVQLVAESSRLAILRGFLGRILGWRSACDLTVDLALRAIRLAAARRSALVVCGDDDMVSVARSLHRRLYDRDRPFVVCDPRRKRTEQNIRSPQNFETGMPALAAAARGTLCVLSHRLPSDFAAVKAALALPDTRVHLFVCTHDAGYAKACGAEVIAIPPLAARGDELARIVAEYAFDAAAELGVTHRVFTRADHAWVIAHEASSLPAIEKATLRLVALRRAEGNVTHAAARLGMARMSLHKWIGRRRLPVPIRVDEP